MSVLPETDSQTVEAGIFLVDKPAGPTSFRMVQLVRRALRIKKVGHAGTLDPFATGLLVICAGRPATRVISQLMAGEKEYLATLKLGVETDTHDLEGRVVAERAVGGFSREAVVACLNGFTGEQLQVPPLFSALKHKGKPLYLYARQGVDIAREPRRIEIKEIECVDFAGDLLTIRVVCGSGTYIRSLAADVGKALGCGAHLEALRRLRSGFFEIDAALPGEALTDPDQARDILLANLMSVEDVLTMLRN